MNLPERLHQATDILCTRIFHSNTHRFCYIFYSPEGVLRRGYIWVRSVSSSRISKIFRVAIQLPRIFLTYPNRGNRFHYIFVWFGLIVVLLVFFYPFIAVVWGNSKLYNKWGKLKTEREKLNFLFSHELHTILFTAVQKTIKFSRCVVIIQPRISMTKISTMFPLHYSIML